MYVSNKILKAHNTSAQQNTLKFLQKRLSTINIVNGINKIK